MLSFARCYGCSTNFKKLFRKEATCPRCKKEVTLPGSSEVESSTRRACFCEHCKTIFQLSSEHTNFGWFHHCNYCAYILFFKTENGDQFRSMPKFESDQDFQREFPKLDAVWWCLHRSREDPFTAVCYGCGEAHNVQYFNEPHCSRCGNSVEASECIPEKMSDLNSKTCYCENCKCIFQITTNHRRNSKYGTLPNSFIQSFEIDGVFKLGAPHFGTTEEFTEGYPNLGKVRWACN